MKHLACRILLAACLLGSASGPAAKAYELASPNGNIKATITFDATAGTLTWRVASGGTAIFAESPLGLLTDQVKFTDGLKLLNIAPAKIDETYTLPQGKVSTYRNKANELTLALEKDGHKLNVIFRAYDDGIAFRYAIPGTGEIQILEEATALNVAGQPVYWGQTHPNQYGYENALGRLDQAAAFSLALLCELKESKHWVLLAQAATYGDYCIPHLTRADRQSHLLKFTFPIDQKEPIKTTRPFASPWRVAVIAPDDLSKIVEQTLFENLNPPTEPELIHADWIQPGRSSWDYIAGDKENWKGWLDFDADMGWEYHLVDGGWRKYVKDPPAATAYARSKGRGLFAWEYTPKLQEEEAIEKLFGYYAEAGLRGSKIDFFDKLPGGKDTTADSEDTQWGLQVRDRICRIAAKHKIQLVFHGCAIPTGERRRWPHLLGTEAIKGQESDPSPQHDNCIAYIRNPLGSVDWSPTLFGKDGKTDAYQLATSVVFESGLLIFAGQHQVYRAHPAKEFLSKVPAAWDETKFIAGYPGSHTVIARRKGREWFVGCLTAQAREIQLPLDFLERRTPYAATIFQDEPSGQKAAQRARAVTASDTLALQTADRGGFVVYLKTGKESP
ncbi:MAG: glycoside hydrolase family 97 N-terminal domain-containing protein [Kiritimatiellaeota bacterium]|nr:glycoside hydrolase family 97 N-terminal domain-containing protein [Kiritimatiellota bacterium]